MNRKLALIVAFFSLAMPSIAAAQDIILEEVVTAEIEKPQAFYVLRASDVQYEGMEPEETFLPELFESVEKAPF